MGKIFKYYRTTIGKKVVMSVTGFLLLGFVVMHMLGNLKIFAGWDESHQMYKMDVYANFLREVGTPLVGYGQALWIARFILLAAVSLHILSAIQLIRLNRQSRPIAYKKKEDLATTYAARTMWVSGILLAVYVVYHLLHMTTGTLHFEGFQHGHVYANVVSAFRVWYVSLIYIAAMGMLCLHLYHGTWSAFQTLGLMKHGWGRSLQNFSRVLALLIFLGYISVPLAVYFGFVPLPQH